MSDLAALDVSISPAEKFREYLATRSKRMTRERSTIVEAVFAEHDHFDAEQLARQLDDGPDRVSRSTVYRTLEQMVDAGMLRSVARQDGRTVYEHDYGYPQHDHLYCQICDKLIEFSSDELQELREAVAREHNFRVTSHRLIISGVCNDCSRKRHRRQSPLDLI